MVWFNDRQGAKIAPHLPANQPGPERKDDRLILSGIMPVLKVGCRWVDCPKEYGPHKTIYNRFARWSARGIWQKIFEAVAGPSEAPKQAALDSSHVKVHRCARGGPFDRLRRGPNFRRLGSTSGGRNSKIHAIVDAFLRPWVLILTPGNTADWVMAQECVSLIPSRPLLAKPASPGIKELLADPFDRLRRL